MLVLPIVIVSIFCCVSEVLAVRRAVMAVSVLLAHLIPTVIMVALIAVAEGYAPMAVRVSLVVMVSIVPVVYAVVDYASSITTSRMVAVPI